MSGFLISRRVMSRILAAGYLYLNLPEVPQFSPTSLSIVHRLISNLQSDGLISSFIASVGNDEISSIQPTIVNNSWNGNKTVNFNGSAYLNEPSSNYLSGANKCTVATILKSDHNSNCIWYYRGSPLYQNLRVQTYAGSHYFTVTSGIYGYVLNTSTYECVERVIWIYDGSQSTNETKLKCFINGVQKTVIYYANIPSELGATSDGTSLSDSLYPANGNMADLMIIDGTITGETAILLDKWLADTYMPDLVIGCGDSITYGYPTGLADSWTTKLANSIYGNAAGRDIRNTSISGAVVSQLAAAATTQIFPLGSSYSRRKILVTAIGTNNIGTYGQDVASTLAEYDAFIADAKAAGFEILGTTILPRQDQYALSANGSQSVTDQKISEWNEALASRVGTSLIGLVNFDLVPELSDPTNTTYYNADRIHLTAAGEDKIANAIGEKLNQI
jgi:lysophospholipase L1-like esterase